MTDLYRLNVKLIELKNGVSSIKYGWPVFKLKYCN